MLLRLVSGFAAADAPLVLGLDDIIERRRGAKITAKGIYRETVRPSKGHFVKASGVRWISLQLLAPVPWAKRAWALPFLTVLAPSERYAQQRGWRQKTLVDWGRQMIGQVRRWLPDRTLVVVADSTDAALDLLASAQRLRRPVTVVTRLCLEAARFDLVPEAAGLQSARVGIPERRCHDIVQPQIGCALERTRADGLMGVPGDVEGGPELLEQARNQ